MENNFVNNVPGISKPRILKKQDSKVVGNNLKLASFLLPKPTQENNLSNSKQCLPVNNVVLKQVVGGSALNSIPKMEVVSANVMNAPSKVDIVTTNTTNHAPKVELVTTSVINNTPKVANNAPKVELVAPNVNNVSKVELITTNLVNCNTVPKLEVDRKIVKLKNFPNALKTSPREKPKIRPRDE